jgi:hypothetical protein
MDSRVSIFNVQLLDDLHNYFPDILYNSSRFESVQDLLRYVQEQTRSRFNLYDVGRNRYTQGRNVVITPDTGGTPQPAAQQPAIQQPAAQQPAIQAVTQPTVQPVISRPLPRVRATAPLRYSFPLVNTVSYSDDIIMQDSTSSLLNLLFQGLNQEPVIVYPTAEQVSAATTVETLAAPLEDPCAICQESMESGTVIRKINACDHSFHKTCIDTWFQRSVNCPNCRADIRGE